MIFGFLRSDPQKEAVTYLYSAMVGAARNPVLYASWAVPDTVEGRFEAVTLHIALVQQRFKALGETGQRCAQLLTDRFFSDLDASIREIGISDIGVPRKMKMLAEGYFGRAAAYEAMFEPGGDPARTLARNLLGDENQAGSPGAIALANYADQVREFLSTRSVDQILALSGDDLGSLARPL